MFLSVLLLLGLRVPLARCLAFAFAFNLNQLAAASPHATR
jgi:hypothetical protein